MTGKKGTVKKIIFGIIGTIILLIVVLIVNFIIVAKNGSVISQGQPIEKYVDHNNALLVIDIQEATTGDVSAYPYFRENSENLIRKINQLADTFRMLNLPVVYIRSEITNPLINLLNSSYAKGSRGAQNDKRLKIVSDLEVVKKGEDSFRNTDLDSMLISNRVNELYIVGLDAAECVNATAEAAQNRGYKVNIIEEAVISKSKEMTDSMMVIFNVRGISIIQSDSLKIPKY